VQRWVVLGIISSEQAAAIRADLARSQSRATGPAPTGHASLVAEALGYLGGAIILVAFGLVAGRFWPDLSTAARLALAAVAAAGMFTGGLAVPTHVATGQRLRSVLWLLSTALTAGFLGLLANLVFGWHDTHEVVFTATVTALPAALLWWRHHHPLQHLALVASLLVAASTATSLLPGAETSPAACAWALGAAWMLLGWAGVLHPRHQVELIGAAVTAGATVFFAAEPWGSPLALLTLVALAVLAVRLHDLPLLGIAAVATLMVLPAVVTTYFHGLLASAAVLLVVGVLLVLAGILTVRRRPDREAAPEPSWSRGTAVQGLTAALALVVVTTVAVVLAALV
jgi:hypothetical protein